MLRVLAGKGFREEQSHHTFMRFMIGGRKTTIYTFFSHSIDEYDDRLLGQVARQLRLKRRQLDDLLDCDMTEDGYRTHLVDNGHVILT